MALALIAGQGALPRVLSEHLIAEGDPPVIGVFADFEPDVPDALPKLYFRLETFGTFLATLVAADVTRLCMAGAVRRVPVDAAKVDARTAPMVPRLLDAMGRGDDGTLREIIAIIEEQGIEVIGAHELMPALRPTYGVPTKAKPNETHEMSARVGDQALIEMGLADLGQACVIRGDQVLATENDAGTQAMITEFFPPKEESNYYYTATPLDAFIGLVEFFNKDDALTQLPGEGAILFKGAKPDQNLRADMPVIGPDTAMDCAAAGFAGIIIEYGRVMVLDLPQIVEILDNAGMFLWVRKGAR